MHIILGVLGVLGAVAIWYWRFKMAQDAAGEVAGLANDARLALRRFGYRRRHKSHPADCVEDTRLAAAGIMAAVAGIDAPLSRAEVEAIAAEAQRVFEADRAEAADIAAFGRWVAGQCNTPTEAVRRLSKVILSLGGAEAGPDLLKMTTRVAASDGRELSETEEEALGLIRKHFNLG